MENLKPCPFCGNEFPTISFWSGGGCRRVDCPQCGIVFRAKSGGREMNMDNVVDAWNRRTNDANN